jgi:hypothetical protein
MRLVATWRVWQALQRAVKLEGAKIGWSMLTVAHRLQVEQTHPAQ